MINSLTIFENDADMHNVLSPMMQILDKKNITKGITFVSEKDKLYICFDRNCLSDNNQLILQIISSVYCTVLFYSDNKEAPNSDRLEYWCPDEWYDEITHIKERCRNKSLFVLELDLKDQFTILGTSIMLANALQEQDPLCLKIYKENTVLDSDMIKRHEHYIASGFPDLKCIHLHVFLNKDNPLNDNPYAILISECGINTPLHCDNLASHLFVGAIAYEHITHVTFDMEKENLEKVIKEYFENVINTNNRNENSPLVKKQKQLAKI